MHDFSCYLSSKGLKIHPVRYLGWMFGFQSCHTDHTNRCHWCHIEEFESRRFYLNERKEEGSEQNEPLDYDRYTVWLLSPRSRRHIRYVTEFLRVLSGCGTGWWNASPSRKSRKRFAYAKTEPGRRWSSTAQEPWEKKVWICWVKIDDSAILIMNFADYCALV